jgi:uncharacterized protein YlxW (UPF0749 family)
MTDDARKPGEPVAEETEPRPAAAEETERRPADRQAWNRRPGDRPSTLGDAGMPSAGRPPAAESSRPPAAGSDRPPAAASGLSADAAGSRVPDPKSEFLPPADGGSAPKTAVGPGGETDAGLPGAAGAAESAAETVDPHAPLAADGPTVRLSSALTVPGGAATRPGGTAPENDPQPADKAAEAGAEPAPVLPPDVAGEEPTVAVKPPAVPVSGDGGYDAHDGDAHDGDAHDYDAHGGDGDDHSDDEQTTLLRPPTVVEDEPTLPDAGRRSFDGGSTMRLQPPFFAPGTTRTPRVTPPADAPAEEGVESRERWDTSPAIPERWPDDERDTPEVWQDDFAHAATAPDRTAETVAEPDGSPDPGAPAAAPAAVTPADGGDRAHGVPEKGRRLTSAGALIWVLLALLGFTLVVQLQSNDDDAGLATARQEDLVGILSDLEARDQRLQQEINALEESQRQLTSGVAGRQAALAEAGKRADELGLLSGTLPARGPGLKISIDPKGQPIKASAILNAVQELRGAGGEVMEIIGDNGVAVRIVASSYFVDADGGQVLVDGKQLSGPYTLWVIGVPSTMQTALQIPGGVVASVSQAGGNVTMEQRSTVEVAAVRQPTSLQYARPVS